MRWQWLVRSPLMLQITPCVRMAHQSHSTGMYREAKSILVSPATTPNSSHCGPVPSRPSHQTVDPAEQQIVNPDVCAPSTLEGLMDSKLPPLVHAIARECRETWPNTVSESLFTSSASECTQVEWHRSQRDTLRNAAQQVALDVPVAICSLLLHLDGACKSRTLCGTVFSVETSSSLDGDCLTARTLRTRAQCTVYKDGCKTLRAPHGRQPRHNKEYQPARRFLILPIHTRGQ